MPSDAATLDVDIVDAILANYAAKGVFKGYARLGHSASVGRYRIRWFYLRRIDINFDRKRQIIALPGFLPLHDTQPALARKVRAFLRSFSDMPEHRRLDEARAQLTLRKKGKALTLAIRSLDGDLDYACRKLVHIANEVFVVFLSESAYDQYKIEGLDVDPEQLWA